MAAKAPANTAIHAFLGTDEALVKEAAMKLSQKLAPKDNEFGLEIVSGSADNADQAIQVVGRAIEAIQTLPFFGGDKVVWLQGVNFVGESQTAKADSTLAALDTLVGVLEAGLPSDVTFILSSGEIDKRRTFYKRLEKIAKVEVHDKLDTTKAGWENAVMGHVADRAIVYGMKFRGAALERFVQQVGSNTRSIDSELQKLSLFAGDRPITDEDVAAVTSQSHTGFIFDIGEAIAKRNLPKTLELIDFQLNRGESAIAILLASIVTKVRQLLHTRDLMETHGIEPGQNYSPFQAKLDKLPAHAIGHLGRTKEGKVNAYGLFMTAHSARNFTLAELRSAIEACLEANLRLVTTGLDHRLVLHQLAARILTKPSAKATAPSRR
jgi:DNA polymerase-3 subunit delta